MNRFQPFEAPYITLWTRREVRERRYQGLTNIFSKKSAKGNEALVFGILVEIGRVIAEIFPKVDDATPIMQFLYQFTFNSAVASLQ